MSEAYWYCRRKRLNQGLAAVPLGTSGGARRIPPKHRNASDQDRVLEQAEYGAREEIDRRRAHEVLTVAGAHAHPLQIPIWLDPIGLQVDEGEVYLVYALGNPSKQVASLAVDSVPHHLTDEPADLTETLHPVETVMPTDISSPHTSATRLPPRGATK